MTRRRQTIEHKQEKRNSKGKLKCLISLIVMIFVYYQVTMLFNYTIGKKVKVENLRIYLWVNELINK